MIETLILILISYLIGAIPTGYIIVQLFYKKDIREYGSKNIGSTNVYRIFGFAPGFLTQIIDIGKGILVVLGLPMFLIHSIDIGISIPLLFGAAAFLGNIKYGKGINISLGIFIYLFPLEAILSIIVFFIALPIFKYISISSIIAFLFFTLLITIGWSMYNIIPSDYDFMIICVMGLTVIVKHVENVRRILKHKEPKINF